VPRLTLAEGQQVLGRELELLVLDAHEGFDPDVFGAASGALVGGGLLLLLSPPLEQWSVFPDPQNARITVAPHAPASLSGRFLARLARLLPTSAGVTVVRQGEAIPKASPRVLEPPREPAPEDGRFRSEDQRLAVAAILKTLSGHRRRPLVLTADRGRGKSAAFGLAAAELLLAGKSRILVTAPHRAAVATLFAQARAHLPGATQSAGRLEWEGGALEFLPPDALLCAGPPADLLLVDEAAGIPLALLERMLQRYARLAFASTVHGYEGTGRGFVLKFHALLDRETPGWQLQELKTPIRWATGDPLEATVNRLLLLDAEIAPADALAAIDVGQCRLERLDRDALAADEMTLRQLFGLLVFSHYRTRPFDLRHLLDGPNLEVHVLRQGNLILATALLAREGGLDPELAPAIFNGERRLQGHLLPQSLVANLGLEEALSQRFGRVMRIAVHPLRQGQGLGSRLLVHLEAQARLAGLDWLGSSFGLAPELLDFWQGNGYQPVRIGMRREASSGAHSALLLRPLSEAAAASMALARPRFQEQLAWQLADSHRNLDTALVRRLWCLSDGPPRLSAAEWREVQAFAHGHRGYEDSAPAIGRLLRARLGEAGWSASLGGAQLEVLVRRVLQHQSWAEIAHALALPGRAATQTALREAVAVLL
ncbi:MAG: GNAT family N-acetyltransferase, partial [Xanthomonadaceae bacterium]|nr:GNAT family N-acetyltransferase [Xanthomonadaceae bacterium]